MNGVSAVYYDKEKVAATLLATQRASATVCVTARAKMKAQFENAFSSAIALLLFGWGICDLHKLVQ